MRILAAWGNFFDYMLTGHTEEALWNDRGTYYLFQFPVKNGKGT
jgi:hypothetical protein